MAKASVFQREKTQRVKTMEETVILELSREEAEVVQELTASVIVDTDPDGWYPACREVNAALENVGINYDGEDESITADVRFTGVLRPVE